MSGKTVLVVDSDQASLHYLAHLLQEQQLSVIKTGMGKEGLIFAWRDHPDLILFDPALSDMDGVDFIKKIRRDARTIATPILALSSDPAPVLKEACQAAGCDAYLPKSGEAAVLLPDVVAGLLSDQEDQKSDRGFLIVLLSAKGGTGTSSLCANYAMVIAEMLQDARVVVADLVLPIGSIASIVGYDGSLDLVSVAGMSASEIQGEYFHQVLPEMEQWQFQLLPGSTSPGRANDLNDKRIARILAALQAAYDYVVVDLGRSLSRISLPIIQKADMLVLIMSTDVSTIALTHTVLEYLKEKGVDEKSIYAILNRAVGLEGLSKDEAEKIIGIPIKATMPYLGSNFTLANNLNQPLTAKFPTDTAAIVLKDSANEVIDLLRKKREFS